MPAEVFGPEYAFLKKEDLLSREEIYKLVESFTKLGVNKIRLTGGEPLLRKDIVGIVSDIASVKGIEDIALTTNAWLLPKLAAPLKEAGLSRINVSLDSLDETTFQKINGRQKSVAGVLAGLNAAEEAGLPIKINMVVEKGLNEADILPVSRYFRDRDITLRFIEFMDVGNHNGWNQAKVFPSKDIINIIDKEFPLEPVNPNYKGEVAKRYRYKDGKGEIGIISSVSQPFCQDCHRARLSADGKLFTCLFAAMGVDLKTPLRQGLKGEQLEEFLAAIWMKRSDRYSEIRHELSENSKKVEMSYIGG